MFIRRKKLLFHYIIIKSIYKRQAASESLDNNLWLCMLLILISFIQVPWIIELGSDLSCPIHNFLKKWSFVVGFMVRRYYHSRFSQPIHWVRCYMSLGLKYTIPEVWFCFSQLLIPCPWLRLLSCIKCCCTKFRFSGSHLLWSYYICNSFILFLSLVWCVSVHVEHVMYFRIVQ